MAELTHRDVTQAVQAAIKPLQNDVARLAATLSAVSNKVQTMDDIAQALRGVQSEVSRHDPRSEDAMRQVQRELQDLKYRFEVVERLAREMTVYFEHKIGQEREDEEYRSSSTV